MPKLRSRSGQERSAIYHQDLPSAESFLHQKHIGLRYVTRSTATAPICAAVGVLHIAPLTLHASQQWLTDRSEPLWHDLTSGRFWPT
jgi:hypothetical protein